MRIESPAILGKVPWREEYLNLGVDGHAFASFDAWLTKNIEFAARIGDDWSGAYRAGAIHAFVFTIPLLSAAMCKWRAVAFSPLLPAFCCSWSRVGRLQERLPSPSAHPPNSLSGELKPRRLSNTRRRAWRSTTPARHAGSHYAYRSLSGT